MNILDKIISFIKLPLKVIVLLAIILSLLLFLPKSVIEILKLEQFINEYGKYIGITFLFSIGYIIIIFIPWILNKKKLKNINRKYLEDMKKELNNLSLPAIFFLREFFLQNKDVIEVPMENTEFIDLYNKHILIMASKNARPYIYGTFFAVRINPIIKNYITIELLQLPDKEFSEQEIAMIKSERPLFVAQINYVNNLFNFPWMRR